MASTTVKEESWSDDLLACRICLASDVKLFHIREWGMEQVFADVMGTPLSVCDGFPQHVCVWCRALLLRVREIRARCRRAEQLLKEALKQQQSITTSYVRSIDRKLHKLSHTFSHYYSSDMKVSQHEDMQTETKVDITKEYNIENYVKDYDTNATCDDDDDDDTDTYSDVKSKIVYVVLEDVIAHDTRKVNIVEESIDQTVKENVNTPQLNVIECINKTVNRNIKSCKQFPEINLIECNDTTIKKDVNSCKRKFPEINVTGRSDETKTKDVKCCKRKLVKKKTEKKQTRKKKGPAWTPKPFSKEEGFKEFEEKYNFKIESVSEEDMVKEMANRKESNNYKLSVFKCDSCFKGFLSQNTYDNHMKVHDPARPFECRLCHKRYFRRSELRDHLRDNHELKFHCLRCFEIVNTKYSAESHAHFHEGKVFRCEYCDQEFRKLTTCNTHMRMAHPLETAEGATCALCGEVFLSAAGLRMHKARSHEPAQPTLRCRTCKRRFESQDAIDRHRRAQPAGKCDNKHSSCAQCGEVYANEQDLLAHRMEQHGLQQFTCDMCGMTFETKNSVATHIDRVHRLIKPETRRAPYRQQPGRKHKKNPRDAVCEVCGKRSTCIAMLKIHMNKHTGARPYKCGLCPKAYATPEGLKTHEPVHSGARKWSCDKCNATFMRHSSLYIHRRGVHSGERAYQCQICSNTFTQSGSLQTHIKYVHMKIKPPPRKRNKKTAT